MASNTENLNLLMKNPSTDGADTFNVQTMLNENWQKIDNNAGTVAQTLANILKPTTPPIIGLPPSTTPDGMFQALGNTGELHVWRKTITSGTGTTTTYPVSTNPNAYQEGDGAKEAGYTLGEVENNVQILSGGDNWPTTLYYADSVDVDNEGQLSLQSPNQYTFTTSSQYQNVSTLAVGRFIKIVPEASSGFSFRDGIWFVPSDATVTVSNYKIYASKIQKDTGYAAIPAGTTIEYLGKLGDKARVQVVSYVGTGTYGSSNPNSLTFDFVPKFCVFTGDDVAVPYLWTPGTTLHAVYLSEGGSSKGTTYNWTVNTVWDSASKKIQWHSTSNAKYQYNTSGKKYRVIAIG